MRQEEEKKRKALKRRTLKEQVKINFLNIQVLKFSQFRIKNLIFREAMAGVKVGAPRLVAAVEAKAARVGAREVETGVAAAAKAIGANRGAKGMIMGVAEVVAAAPARKAASQRHRAVRGLPIHLLYASETVPTSSWSNHNVFDATEVNQFSERRVTSVIRSHCRHSLGRFRAQKQGCLILRKAAVCPPSSSVGAREGRLLDGGVELDQRAQTAVGEGQAEGGGGGIGCGIQLVLSPRREGQARQRHRLQTAERLLLEGMEVREGNEITCGTHS